MCAFPYSVRLKPSVKYTGGRTIPVPCGKCPECVRARTNAWTFRLSRHLETVTNPLFVTLTYSSEFLPKVVDTSTGEITKIPTLCSRDVQLFFKNLRYDYQQFCTKNDLPVKKLSYFLCGEYGTKRGRPHYHILLFNLDDYRFIEPAWGLGSVHIKPLSDGGISYTLKYMGKQTRRAVGQVREFSRMSKGLGSNYLTPNVVSMHTGNLERCYITLFGGIKIPMPKYFKDKIYSTDERERISQYMQARAEQTEDDSCKRFLKNRPRNSKNAKQTTFELAKYSQKHLIRTNEIF